MKYAASDSLWEQTLAKIFEAEELLTSVRRGMPTIIVYACIHRGVGSKKKVRGRTN